MFKTKAELETIAEELEDEQFEELVNGDIHSREFFENFVMVLNLLRYGSFAAKPRSSYAMATVTRLRKSARYASGARGGFGPPFFVRG